MHTIQDLMGMFEVKNRKSIYDWFKVCGITPQKDGKKSFITDDDLQILKDLRAWVDKGGSLSTFTPSAEIITIEEGTSSSSENIENTEMIVKSEQSPVQLDFFAELTKSVTHAVVSSIKSPIEHWKELEYAYQHKIILASREIYALIGSMPKGKEFKRGSFKFVKNGKIGRAAGWQIEKED